MIRAGTGEDEQAGTPGDPNKNPFCSFWKGTDLRVCTELCSVLDEAEIPHKTIRRQDHMFNLNNQSPYEVGVPASMYEKAELAVKEAFGTDADQNESPLLLNEQSSAGFQELVDTPLEENLRTRPEDEIPSLLDQLTWRERRGEGGEEHEQEIKPVSLGNGENRHPEDATVEVWEGEPAELREMMEMSLRENSIWTRRETQDGKSRLFVLPEDAERSKEIVREILEGDPMK
jgi:hypothetical protein